MKGILLFILFLFTTTLSAAKVPEGSIEVTTKKSVETIVKEAKHIFDKKGITLFAIVKHHEAAKKNGQDLPATVTMIFGNPKLGTPLMKDQRSVALDLPQKLLIYQNNDKTHMLYNSSDYLKDRHDLSDLSELKKIESALKSLTSALSKKK